MERRRESEWIQDNLHIRLFKMESLPIGTDWNARDVRSAFWRFYRNDGDGASLEMAEGDYSLLGGRLYFVPAGVRFSCRNITRLRHFYIHFDVIGVPAITMRELFGSPLCLPPATDLERDVTALAERLQAGQHDDITTQFRAKSALYHALALAVETMPPEQIAHGWRQAEALEPVLPAIRHIEENVSASLTNRQLSALCHLSENFFIRRFRQCVGQTPAQYILEQRVRLAAQRLLFTDHSIERIADESGFGNRFYFSRVFARHTGVAPAAYRKAARV